ncbi:hypothetical protein SAMN04515679_1783 [Pelosinus fermentans]|uniref:PsbP C-terminal domain-containing protein n=1 Tax=Pelosinus fermentans B4 TaxID=1149862 RepID=I8RKI6_9FIRM|nr:hypothetical protein [Pelosinus fermentans]EIW20733.1 hypothetical protein FB4_1945 [Pelosinus fermentans B4]EIW25422.1 hypothetical protein FA11_2581 [Pelosinus fermentans A11]OAM93680.1 hypothetical protein FR7_01697 [Pelosinus fermentans DSM 17108]SDQ86366.1 hypothetical protein SAMN04515679_1783 [Pelosinus fermentans]
MIRNFILVLTFILFITPCTFAADMTIYEDNDYHFKFSYPSDWKVHQYKIENISVTGLSPLRKDPLNSSIPTFEVDVQNYPIKNIDEVFSSQSVNKLIKDFQEDPLSKKISVDVIVADYFVTHLKDKKAIFIKATILMPYLSNSKFVEERYVIFHNSNRYDISFCGTLDDLNNNRKIMEQILNSFEFSK